MLHECSEIPMLSLFKHKNGPYRLPFRLNVPAYALKPIDIRMTTYRFVTQYKYLSDQRLEYCCFLRLRYN